MTTKRILLDCDPGHDDAIAILLAAGTTRAELVGITTVAGNQTLDKTTRNALAVATVGRIGDIPVFAGHDRPLVRPLRTAPRFHGESGLDGPSRIVPDRDASSGHAVDFIVESVMSSPGDVSLVATGPLTNVAAALRREPRVAQAVHEFVIMGGAYGPGNVTQTAEFNIFVDPEAAAIVFGAPWSVTMVTLDVTHQAGCTRHVQRRIEELGTPVGGFVSRLLEFYRGAYLRHTDLSDPPVHDPCAIAYVLSPEIFETRSAAIDVELTGRWTAGTTVVRFAEAREPPAGRDLEHLDPRHRVPVRIDSEALYELIIEALRKLA